LRLVSTADHFQTAWEIRKSPPELRGRAEHQRHRRRDDAGHDDDRSTGGSTA